MEDCILPKTFYDRDTVEVARELLGKQLVHVVDGMERRGIIVETEAYVGAHDLACHASKGVTPRTEVMYGPPGLAYVYLIYGMYHCMNIVTEPAGNGCAVLLRALEPVANLEGNTRGPGLLCKAMAIDRSLNRHAMDSGNFYVADAPPVAARDIVMRPRIGVAYAKAWAEKELRFYLRGNPYISKK